MTFNFGYDKILAVKTKSERENKKMKSTGIERKIDELGRIVVPIEIRKSMGIEKNDPIDIYVDGDKIILKKTENKCVFCHSDSELTEFKGKKICKACLAEING